MKILTVVGARPQFVKAAPWCRAVQADHKNILVHTGQHYDQRLSDVFFAELGIPPAEHYLGVGSAPHAAQTGRIMEALESVVHREKPEAVVVLGDTNSTLAAALTAVKMGIPVGHIEAGLRSYDRSMPEEVNRVVADHVSRGLYCPTETAVGNLRREGIQDGVFLVGDIMVDAFNLFQPNAVSNATILERFGLESNAYWMVTIHRASNTDDGRRLASILEGLASQDEPILFPMHPRTKNRIETYGLGKVLADAHHVRIVDPLSYFESLAAITMSRGVITDSGGVQKEAYLAGRPCLTVRPNTEWPETIRAGWNRLVGSTAAEIQEAMLSFEPTAPRPELFGDGRTAARIVDQLPYLLGGETKP